MSESNLPLVDHAPTESENHTKTERLTFPIVGLGASAGGLDAFKLFFNHLPHHPHMAFIIVQHLDPQHVSQLPEILQNYTSLRVVQATQGQKVQANLVYVIPAGKDLRIKNGVLQLNTLQHHQTRQGLIDLFFRSLAADQRDNAVAVILSGTGSDGTIGVGHIKEQGGLVLVQEPEKAQYPEMPRNAIEHGFVDMVAPIVQLVQKLVQIYQIEELPSIQAAKKSESRESSKILEQIFAFLKSKTGTDFSNYKRSTILRRLERRMQITERVDLAGYLALLRQEPREALALQRDFLISVTNFFRDKEAWQALEKIIIPQLFLGKRETAPIRIWVPGCATGEEAYSLAMLLLEYTEKTGQQRSIKIFASDLDEDAIYAARRGSYSTSIELDISTERLERFFEKSEASYVVKKSVKELILFATHNLIKDPPFARLDLISCRNLLIYFTRPLQEQVFQLFRYALVDEGYLFLGGSETAEKLNHLFAPIEKKFRLYKTQPGRPAMPKLLQSKFLEEQKGSALPSHPDSPVTDLLTTNRGRLGDLHRSLMLQRYGHPSILVNQQYEIRYKFGEVGRFLHHMEGEPSLNLLDNVSETIRIELRTGLYGLFQTGKAATPRLVQVKMGETLAGVRLLMEPVPDQPHLLEKLALVIFEQLPRKSDDPISPAEYFENYPLLIQQLEDEIIEIEHTLKTTIEEYETSNEELKTTNEEMQSTNEELRSTTEELEASREELFSTNEELNTLNRTLKEKISELNRANSDLENLMKATDIATIFLNRRMHLQRYTSKATAFFHMIPSDIGRPFYHITHKLQLESLTAICERVLNSLETFSEEVSTEDGRWYLLQIRPYYTLDYRIDGVVLTLVDITPQMQAEQEATIRAQQQATVAELGMIALENIPPGKLFEIAVKKVATVLHVELAKVLQLLPDEQELLLVAGVGWSEGLVGSATVENSVNSQAGFTLQSQLPVIVESLPDERRFQGPDLLLDHDVISGLSVIIHGRERPFGVFGAHTPTARRFVQQEADFLQAVANVLAAAVEQHRSQAELNQLITRINAERDLLQMTGELEKVGGWELHADALNGTWTKETAAIHGLSPDPFQHIDTILSLYLPQARQKLEAAIRKAIAQGKPYELELELISAKGQHKWVRTMGLPLTSGGKVVKIQGIFQDITARKTLQAENERWETQYNQAQKMESIGRLAGGIAHDFNNLLVPIIGRADIGMRQLPVEHPLHKQFSHIKEAGERAANLVRQILAFGRKQRLEMMPLELNHVVKQFKSMLAHILLDGRIQLQQHFSEDPLPIEGDKVQLEQVLLNLVINARDAMPDDGLLIIETASVQLDDVYLAEREEMQTGAYAMLAVSDTGHGMDKETKEQIFEPFFTTRPTGQGTGLGLATVYGIVKQHEGHIFVYSEINRGSTFKIYLPLAESISTTPAETAVPKEQPTGGDETILLVEDDDSVRQIVRESLQSHGYHILEASEPSKALSIKKTYDEHIDLLLTDVILPQMDGQELYKQLVSLQPDLKVLYMSGYTEHIIIQQDGFDNFLRFLQKPFTINSLLNKVRNALESEA